VAQEIGIEVNRGRRRSSMSSEPRGRLGRVAPFCPVASHVDLLGDRQSVVDLDAEGSAPCFQFYGQLAIELIMSRVELCPVINN
jgi:hypothetical protein